MIFDLLTSGTSQDVAYFIFFLRVLRKEITARIVSDQDRLAANRNHVFVRNTAKFPSVQAGAINDEISSLTGMMNAHRFDNMIKVGSFEDDIPLDTLRDQP